MNDEAFYRTAPATPGLLNIQWLNSVTVQTVQNKTYNIDCTVSV